MQDFFDLYDAFIQASQDLGTRNQVNREAFWEVAARYDVRNVEANRLFSSFDIDRKDVLDIRDFMACLRCFRNSTESLQQKLEGKLTCYRCTAATCDSGGAHSRRRIPCLHTATHSVQPLGGFTVELPVMSVCRYI